MALQAKIYQRLDYAPYPYQFVTTTLDFSLSHERTLVTLVIVFKAIQDAVPMVLDGKELKLINIEINGTVLEPEAYVLTDEHLTILKPPVQGELHIVTAIHPHTNASLLGLFSAEADLLTQCEAEGFRRITYFADRPDVLSVYTVTLRADKIEFPVLLSNGNLLANGENEDGKHFTVWHDPFAKPSYLFALVAGSFACVEEFVEQNGQSKRIQFYVKPQDVTKIDFARKSLRDAIDWDFQYFKLPIDLERFMVVATSTFNAGAMENKGLNIFNTKYILADENTATDEDFANVEAIIGHEYFHNWTGNRVTCRSWFELSLKEGLTVYREQEFSAHQLAATCKTALEAASARAVKRIAVAENLKNEQFVEDAGPMAHSIRPNSYQEISNFYTATIYEKGAEVVRMYHTLLGEAGFNRGLAYYLSQYDGQAVTCDDFRLAMAKSNDVDLSQFELWYRQAGTPRVTVQGNYDKNQHTYTLTLIQSCPKVGIELVDGNEKQPFHIPFNMGLLASCDAPGVQAGQDLSLQLQGEALIPTKNGHCTIMLPLTKAVQTLVFERVPCVPIPSFNRQFGAPIIVNYDYSTQELCFLLNHDADTFNRWDAAHQLWLRLVTKQINHPSDSIFDITMIGVLQSVLKNPQLSEAFRAKIFSFPDFDEVAQHVKRSQLINPQALYDAIEEVQNQLGCALYADWQQIYQQLHFQDNLSYSANSAGLRALKNLSMLYVARAQWHQGVSGATALAQKQYVHAQNMTDRLAAFGLLVEEDTSETQAAIQDFYERFTNEALVVDKWFETQAVRTCFSHAQTMKMLQKLIKHPAYVNPTPNRVHALVFSFCYGNPQHFHQLNRQQTQGAGYQFWAKQVIALDKLDPQLSASLARALEHWRDYEAPYRQAMLAAIKLVQQQDNLSSALSEIMLRMQQ